MSLLHEKRSTDQVTILHMPRQLSSRGMRKIVTWSSHWNHNESKNNTFKRFQLRAHKLFVKWVTEPRGGQFSRCLNGSSVITLYLCQYNPHSTRLPYIARSASQDSVALETLRVNSSHVNGPLYIDPLLLVTSLKSLSRSVICCGKSEIF